MKHKRAEIWYNCHMSYNCYNHNNTLTITIPSIFYHTLSFPWDSLVTVSYLPCSESPESVLVHDLLARYAKHGTIAQPLTNSSNPLQLYYGLRLITLDLDEKTQTLTTSAWVRMVRNTFILFMYFLFIYALSY